MQYSTDDTSGEDVHKRKVSRRFSIQQTEGLVHVFNIDPSPSTQVRDLLAKELGITPQSVRIWFQNRRRRMKALARRAEEVSQEHLPPKDTHTALRTLPDDRVAVPLPQEPSPSWGTMQYAVLPAVVYSHSPVFP